MREYIDLGHMEKIPTSGENIQNSKVPYYIPHHFVLKPSSTTTKFRVVFDASAKTTSGISLNEKLMVGPKLQDDLIPLLLRFRTHTVAMTADITKMYRQVLVDRSQLNLQRIVWRESPDLPLREYQLCTVTYGTASAPYLATKCLQQLAQDEEKNFPIAAPVVKRDFYVDDLQTGEKNTASGLVLQDELIKLMKSGGFEIIKWSSNDRALIESLPPEYRASQSPRKIDIDESVKTLGITWHPASDNFCFVVNVPKPRQTTTKRTLLSDLAKVFDPLGWLSPVTIKGKITFQKLWLLPLSWDDPLPSDMVHEWSTYCIELPLIEKIIIPRCIKLPQSCEDHLHGFSDASMQAYGAVVYVRSLGHDGQVKVKMLTAKTKVAPIKQISLPRLELCGALLLAKLMDTTQKYLGMEFKETHAWSDSTVVLAWLSSYPNRWKTFVANRVSEIQDIIPHSNWHHVAGEDNPADCASRGISPALLENHPLWWHGPKWLSDGTLTDQLYQKLIIDEDTSQQMKQEERIEAQIHTSVDLTFISRFSSLTKLKRITAYCLRFSRNCKVSIDQRLFGFLTTQDLQNALVCHVKMVQASEYNAELKALKDKKKIPSKSRIRTLNPFLDNVGVIRVGGRLQHSNMKESQKHQIVLPRNSELTNLIVTHYHLTNLHAGPQLLQAIIRQQFWIICAQDVVRHFVRRCVVCHRLRAETATQMMGNLSLAKVNQSRPFQQCGVDYAGPFMLRVLKGRGLKKFKGYISLFICFVTRAIHLEVVSDLTTDAFIAALQRFTARRGKCTDIYSDCGTNFVGANSELKEFIQLTKSIKHNQAVSHFLTNDGTNWHFNPPGAPHFGGLWEAGVKSAKHHLKRVMGDVSLTYEEMSTVLCQVEACLNSRPLSPMSSDPSDLSVLTPGHFLIGGPLTSIPEPDYTSIPMNRLSRWQLAQQLSQHFWKRWSSEYLSRLQQRPKWLATQKNLEVNDLVLVKDDTAPPLKWRLGRILQVHPGKDNRVRVVTLKTADGELKRPFPLESTE